MRIEREDAVTRVFVHRGWRTWLKALLGLAMTAAGFVMYGEIGEGTLRIAAIVLFACGLLLTRYYGVQSGRIREMTREGETPRLRHHVGAILLRLLVALAATASAVWMWLELATETWVRWVPIVGGVVSALLTVHFFREILIRAAADVKAEDA
jgi:hypothetical protein